MVIFTCNKLTKKHDFDTIFESVSFGIEDGEKVGFIGRNGIGKTSLLNIIAGKSYADEGEVVFNNQVTFQYLEQNPTFDSDDCVLDAVMKTNPELFNLLENHKIYSQDNISNKNVNLDDISHKIDNLNGWAFESEAKSILSKLGMNNFFEPIRHLSGGQKKRVALAKMLLAKPTLLIMDEPTNHLDADSVQWLQDFLMNTSQTLLFVTHDRYFLDAVSTRILELDNKRIYSYPGNYEKYLELKEEQIEISNSNYTHFKSKLRDELAWLQKGAKARRTKQKSRIDWIDLMQKEHKPIEEKKIKIELGKTFLGKQIIEAHYITKSLSNKLLFKDFSYIAKPGDKIGIIGPNGTGKTTLFNVLSGISKIDDGNLKIGDSIKIGYFTQDNLNIKDNETAIGTLRQVAEYIDVGQGRDRYITAKELLNRFQFKQNQHSSLVGNLSGGEKRKLSLLKVFMANPNVLFLDEPTNDLDIQTLEAIENFLDDFYGVLLIISHDRAFLDRTVDFIFYLDGEGKIKEYPGNYSYYLEKKEEQLKIQRANSENKNKSEYKPNPTAKKKLSFKELRELEDLDKIIPQLEKEKTEIEEKLNNPNTDYKIMEQISSRLVEINSILDEKTLRWLELQEWL